jgi:transposase
VRDVRPETAALKEVVADLGLENRLLKKSTSGDGEEEASAFEKLNNNFNNI